MNLVEVVRKRFAERGNEPLRILLDTPRGVWLGENLGDIAMCRGAVRRLHSLSPGCRVSVVVDDARVLGAEASGIGCVPSTARAHWLRDPSYLGGRCFAEAFDAADVVATTGHGALVDLIRDGAIDHLRVLARAHQRGASTALLGHGIGPIEDPHLFAAAAETLPLVDLICIRETALAIPLLARLGVAPSRVVVAGDDAFEIAFARWSRPRTNRRAIGVSLRLSGMDHTHAAMIVGALRAFAGAEGLAIEPLPIDHSDVQILGEFGLESGQPTEVEPVLKVAGRCLAIVAGSYHACVFGLAQSTPVVAVAASDFYRGKMNGLATWFPSGCEVLDVSRSGDLEATTRLMLQRATQRSDAERSELGRVAARQVETGRSALAGLLDRVRVKESA